MQTNHAPLILITLLFHTITNHLFCHLYIAIFTRKIPTTPHTTIMPISTKGPYGRISYTIAHPQPPATSRVQLSTNPVDRSPQTPSARTYLKPT
ncbi:hypothetical protein HOY80DRAFT_966917 [Tuber brumale]|nr:hypothetical protein HOY80DRAFT_966917 [Tuber brumale]